MTRNQQIAVGVGVATVVVVAGVVVTKKLRTRAAKKKAEKEQKEWETKQEFKNTVSSTVNTAADHIVNDLKKEINFEDLDAVLEDALHPLPNETPTAFAKRMDESIAKFEAAKHKKDKPKSSATNAA